MLPTAKCAAKPPVQHRHEAVIAGEEREALFRAKDQQEDAKKFQGHRQAMADALRKHLGELPSKLATAPWRQTYQVTKDQVDAAFALCGAGPLDSDDSFTVEEIDEGPAEEEVPSPDEDVVCNAAAKKILKGLVAGSSAGSS